MLVFIYWGDHPNSAVNPPAVNAPNPTSSNPAAAPIPAAMTPAPTVHSVPVGAPSPIAASSGGYSISATILSTLFIIPLSISFFSILV